MIRGFATAEPLTDDALHAAGPPRYPRPSRLAVPLEVSPAPAAKGAERLGLHTVGDLLEHLPRDRQAARTIGELALEETATVIAEVRSITSRSVRRRGMKPLVEAVVADATGHDEGDVLQPAVARAQVPAGDAAAAAGQVPGPQPLPRLVPRADRRGGRQLGDEMATYPATDGLSSTQILALARQWRGAAFETLEPLPARLRAIERLPDRAAALDRRPLRRPRGRAPPARVRGADAAPDRAAAPPRPPPRGRARRAARAARGADAPLARRLAAVHAHRRPAPRDGDGRRRPRARPPDAAAADGRGRLGQDRGRALRDAARGRGAAPRPR